MSLSRRTFLAGAGALGASRLLRVQRASAQRPRSNVLVVVFLRGGLDSLHAVVPYGERAYYTLRPTIAVPRPGGDEGAALRIDRRFGFHPALAPLKTQLEDGNLAVVVATGLPQAIRSHFDAQFVMERGGARRAGIATDGWLARAQRLLGDAGSPLRSFSVGSTNIESLAGANAVALDGAPRGLNDPEQPFTRGLLEMYGELSAVEGNTGASSAQRAGSQGIASIRHYLQQQRRARSLPETSFPTHGFGRQLQTVSQLIRVDPGVQLVALDLGGWDTHRGEARTMNTQLQTLATGLSAFQTSLGEDADRVVLVAVSEFGRTAAENGTQGTDHGWGTFAWVLGKRVRAGIHGRWPGLSRLFEGRDLEATTDYRDVLAHVGSEHLGVSADGLFPGFQPGARLRII
ncbi:MAG: DUF1501 domain-containing protein [Myxococcota bacterium]